MADAVSSPAPVSAAPQPVGATGVLVLASGEVAWGRGFGAEGQAVGEVCFHTAMTGYQEIMTDPSFAGQIITFTFPHIGNVGANPDDVEADNPHALGMIVREDVTAPSSFRAVERLDGWMKRHARIGLSGIDTRALTRRIRAGGAPNGVIAHAADGVFDIPLLLEMARAWPGLEGMDLAASVSTEMDYGWDGGVWRLGFGYGQATPPPASGRGPGGGRSLSADDAGEEAPSSSSEATNGERAPTPNPLPLAGGGSAHHPHIVAIDYGSKRNMFRNLVKAGAKVSVVPATATYDQIMALAPDGIFLSNGPGDPAATGAYAVPVIRALLETGKPLFGICLGHQLLGLAVGATTTKMFQGPPRREPPGQAAERRCGRDHQHEPRLRGRTRLAARECPRDACVAVRREQCGAGTHRPPGVQRAVSPRSEPGAAG